MSFIWDLVLIVFKFYSDRKLPLNVRVGLNLGYCFVFIPMWVVLPDSALVMFEETGPRGRTLFMFLP